MSSFQPVKLGHSREFFAQFPQLFQGHAFSLPAAAAGARVADDAGIAADRISVHRVVYRAVAHPGFLHAADHRFKGLGVFADVAVQLHIADVARVGQGVIRGLQLNFLKGPDVVIDRHMEGICIIIPVGDAGDFAVDLFINPHEPAGKALGGGGQQSEV